MSNEETQRFWKRADEYIAVANKQSKTVSTGKVGSFLMYAAARFCAFDVASKSSNKEDMESFKEDAVSFHLG